MCKLKVIDTQPFMYQGTERFLQAFERTYPGSDIVLQRMSMIVTEEGSTNGILTSVAGKPAFEVFHEDGSLMKRIWYKDGLIHREDGPAYLAYDDQGNVIDSMFFIEGAQVETL